MGAPLAARLSRFLVGCHPRRWRQRYAGELLEVLDQHHPTARTVLNLWASAVSAHLDPAYRTGRHPMTGLRRLAPWSAAAAAVLLLPAGCLGIGAWREEHGSPVPLSQGTYGVAFSPDGRIVATVNPALELWDAADRAHPKRLAYTHGPLVMPSDPAFSPDGRLLATAGGGSGILWNVADPARLAEITALPGPGGTGALLFSPDGRILATAGNGTVALWNVADPAHATHITTLTGQAGDVTALSFSPDGHLLASASDNGTVIVRNLTGPAAPAITATLRFTVPPPRFPGMATGPDVALAFSADGHTLTTIAGNTTVTLWNMTDPSAARRITTITGSSIGPGEVAFSPGGRTVAGAAASGDTVALWTLP